MTEFSNSQGTKIYFKISEKVNKVLDVLLKYNNQDKLDLFVREWMDEYDRKEDYSVLNSEKVLISLDISDYDDSTRGHILAWGRFIMRQDSFFEFMARKYCIETLKKINDIFGITINTKAVGAKLKHMSPAENDFFTFLLTQKRRIIDIKSANGYICNARAIKNEYGIDLYSINDVSSAQELVRMFQPYGQYSDFNTRRHGAPRALTNAYVEYLEYKQSHQ